MRYTLTGDEQAVFDVGRKLGTTFDREYWTSAVSRRAFPRELWAELGRDGHLGVLVDAEQGGSGGSLVDLALLTEGLATAGFPMLSLITGPGLAVPAISAHGPPALREQVLPELLSGQALVAFAITEAEAGSNILNVATTADDLGDEVVVRGGKVFTSIADVADHVLVVARTEDAERGRLGYTLVLVPRGHPGLTIEPMTTTVAAAERQCRLTFDDVVVSRDHVVGPMADGLRVLFPAIATERVLSGALSCGIGQFCLDRARDHTLERQVFDVPLATHQGVQHPLAEASCAVAGARHLVRAAAVADAEGDAEAIGLSNMACFAAGMAGYQASDAALQALGGRGYTPDGELHDAFGLARLLRSAPVNSQSALSAVGESVLGMPRSY